ncbi:MAG: LytTR family DNA-binding domain-containing protein [Bacillota bacterium]
MKIKVMIAEDETMPRKELEYLLSQHEDLILCPSATNGKELLEFFENYHPNVIFVDIQMPGLKGMEVAKYLKAQKKSPLIVFTTAYDEYAVEAFGLNAIDYLLKPYGDNRLQETLDRIRKEFKEQNISQGAVKDKIHASKISKLLLDDGERLFVVDPKTIYYLVREERMVQVYTEDNVYKTKLTLQNLEEKLSPYNFFRSHRSYLVNLYYVGEIVPWFNGAYTIILKDKNKTRIPVSRSAAKNLLKMLQI